MTIKESMIKCDKSLLIDTAANYIEFYCESLHDNNLKGLLMIRKKSRELQRAINERNLVSDVCFWNKIFSKISDLMNYYDSIDNTPMADLLMDILGRVKCEVEYDD